jgi:hypothetical protein
MTVGQRLIIKQETLQGVPFVVKSESEAAGTKNIPVTLVFLKGGTTIHVTIVLIPDLKKAYTEFQATGL